LSGVRFMWRTAPLRIHGAERVESIEVTGANIPCDMVIVAIGQTKQVPGADRGIQFQHGRVVVDPETGQTANPKYFAGGDCVNGGREVVDAVAEGKRAAYAISKHVGILRSTGILAC